MKCMHMIYRDRDHSEGRGVGVNGRLEPFRKIIRFGSVTRPLQCNALSGGRVRRGRERKKNLLAKTCWSAEAVIQRKFKRNRKEKRKDKRKKSCILQYHRDYIVLLHRFVAARCSQDTDKLTKVTSGKHHHHLI